MAGELDDITPEELQALMELGVLPAELQENQRRRILAEERRYGKGSEGRTAGRVFVAANPLEHVRDAIQRYKAGKEMKGLDSGRGDILRGITGGRSVFANLLRGHGMGSPVGMPGAPVPVAGPAGGVPMQGAPQVPGPGAPGPTPPMAFEGGAGAGMGMNKGVPPGMQGPVGGGGMPPEMQARLAAVSRQPGSGPSPNLNRGAPIQDILTWLMRNRSAPGAGQY